MSCQSSHAVVTGSSLWEWSDTLVHLRRKRREQETLSAVIEESRQKSEELRLLKEERQQEAERTRGLSRSQDILPKKDRETSRAVKAEKQKRELTNMETELQKLQEEQSSLERRIEQQLQQVQRCSLFHDFMQRVVQATKFENVQAITDSLENLLHTREQFSERFSRADEQVNRQRKALLTQEEQHRLTVLGRSNQLLQLQTELERTFSEAEFWEREWSQIQETAANETLLLGQIKMATLNLHELTNGEAENAGAGATYDTELLLEKISVFVQDHDDIVKWENTFT